MDNFATNTMLAVQEGLNEMRVGGIATTLQRLQQMSHDVVSFITANGMALAALAVVGLLSFVLLRMAFNAYQEHKLELMFAEEEAGKLQLEVFDLQEETTVLGNKVVFRERIIHTLSEELKRLKEEKESLDLQVEGLSERNEKLVDEVASYVIELEEMTEDRDDWRDEANEWEAKFDDKDEDYDELREAYNALEEEKDALAEEVDDLVSLVDLHKELVAANDEVYAEAA